MFAALIALTLRRGAVDPVCGMRVDRATALVRQSGGGRSTSAASTARPGSRRRAHGDGAAALGGAGAGRWFAAPGEGAASARTPPDRSDRAPVVCLDNSRISSKFFGQTENTVCNFGGTGSGGGFLAPHFTPPGRAPGALPAGRTEPPSHLSSGGGRLDGQLRLGLALAVGADDQYRHSLWLSA